MKVLAVPLNNDTVTPGALCLLIVVLMGVALFFLLRSMNRQIGKIEAPKEADLKQAEWERQERERQAAKKSAS